MIGGVGRHQRVRHWLFDVRLRFRSRVISLIRCRFTDQWSFIAVSLGEDVWDFRPILPPAKRSSCSVSSFPFFRPQIFKDGDVGRLRFSKRIVEQQP